MLAIVITIKAINDMPRLNGSSRWTRENPNARPHASI